MLRQVSSLFHQNVRKIDVVCRYGGEEFALLLTQTSAAQAVTVAEKLRKLVAGWQFPALPRTVTISAGVAVFDRDAQYKRELIEAADAALYEAKRRGRNQAVLYSELARYRQEEAG